MRSFRAKDQTSQKSLSAQAWDGILVFILKTVIPLIPIAGIAYLVVLVVNAEVNGVYNGTVPEVGAIRIVLAEDSDRLSGSMILGTKDRYKIIDGKMLGDNKLHMLLGKDDESAITGLVSQSGSSKTDFQKPPSESSVPEELPTALKNTENKIMGPQISIDGEASQGVLKGQMIIDGKVQKFETQRNTFSSFFGWRWINRTLRYFGIKI